MRTYCQIPLESYRQAIITRGNALTFAYDAYEEFQSKIETVAMALDIEDAHSSVDNEVSMLCLGQCRVHRRLVRWIYLSVVTGLSTVASPTPPYYFANM